MSLTPRIEIGARLDFVRPNADELDVAGGRVRTRMLLCEQCAAVADLGGYLEFEAPRDEASDFEIAGRLIASRRLGRFELRVNPIFSLPVVSEERRTLNFSYAAAIYADVVGSFRVGVEAFGAIGEIRNIDPARQQQHYAFVTGAVKVLDTCGVAFGPGFGLTRESDAIVLKLAIDCDL